MSNASIITSIGSGICFGHVPPIPTLGNIITGSSNVSITNLGSARNTDIIMSFCGHIGIIIVGSSTVNVNSLQKTRVGSIFTGTFMGSIISGVGTVNTGG